MPPPSFPGYLSGVKQQFEKFAAPQPTLLTVQLANVTAYYQDTVDLTLLAATRPTASIAATPNNFAPIEVIADIVQINEDTAVKGLYLSKNLVTKSSPTPPNGTNISDATIVGFRHDVFKILYPDPADPTGATLMEIGSIDAAGTSGKTIPPGEPPEIGGGDWAITGGTGAFLGITGQMGGQGGAGGGAIRAASVREDPSLRRTNASPNDIATMFLYVIPLMPPQIIEIFHAPVRFEPFFAEPVTQANPAQVGETLTLYATGLGPVRDQSGVDVPMGQPFPANSTVISPVTITIGNLGFGNPKTKFAPQSAQGFPAFSNGYAVEFILPDVSNLAITEATSIQISSAWIQSAVGTLYVQ